MASKAEEMVTTEQVLEAFDGGHMVYMTLLAERHRLAPFKDRGGPFSVYLSLVDLAERLLKDVAAGDTGVAAWAWTVMQEQIPAMRERAGLEAPWELETELRERYGIPEPEGAVVGSIG